IGPCRSCAAVVDVITRCYKIARAKLMVQPADHNVAMQRARTVADVVARIGCSALTVGQWDIEQIRTRYRIDTFRRNSVVLKRKAIKPGCRCGIVDQNWIALTISQVGEIAGTICERRNSRGDRLARSLARLFPCCKEVGLVFADRPTDRAAELIQLNWRLLRC